MKLYFFALSMVLTAATIGCATTPKTIEGRKVIGTKVVNGKTVYIVEGDQDALKREVLKLKEATKDVTIDPVKSEK